jgi:enolase-phosphatase E1
MTIRCVLTDIEGTIIPIAFVRDILFPYAYRRIATFLNERREDSIVRQWAKLCEDTVTEEEGTRPQTDDLANVLQRWIEEDRKHTGLKGLQGMIWEEGYRIGAFAPTLYDDVCSSLMAWQAKGLQLALYSSGSEQAQRLLIAHTTDGNLTSLFTHYFDTHVGPKTDSESYCRIAQLLALPADTIMFLSDVEAELNAAAAASFKTTQIVRPGTQTGSRHQIAANFHDVTLLGFAQLASSAQER